MALSLVSLLLLPLAIYGILRLIRMFWAWLRCGKLARNVADQCEVSPEVRQAIDEIDRFEAERKLETGKGGKRPHLTRANIKELIQARITIRDAYLDSMTLGWFQCVIIFFIASILGLVVEWLWMLATTGISQGRYGLVWGPFSPLYGFGALAMTIPMYFMRKHGWHLWQVFLISMLIGGIVEQVCGWGMYTFMGAVSWDYSYVPGHITRWVAWPFLVFWGILGVIWYAVLLPPLLFEIGEPTTQRQIVFITLLSAYLIADLCMTLACFARRTERAEGIPPSNAFEEWVDENYTDEFMANRFQNMVIEKTGLN